ncbi:MAG: membrane-bound lytic murein transglycosylase D [Psychromonas sp.]|jgi:membrane-bound lytic murein transglycosylase D
MRITLIIALFSLTFTSWSQSDSLIRSPFVETVEQSLKMFYAEQAQNDNYDSVINALNYEANEVPTFLDAVYCERLEKMNDMSPFDFQCNAHTLSTVKFFAKNRRNFVRVVMGRSELYFDMFEATLSKYSMPMELKYLAVIESGLRPQVKSRAGALGLWQFMYRTGKYYDLDENSYMDERMDPVLATDAACRYLKKLHEIYNDWNLALAAYNAGPGNVNKAIRRSGGKVDYWEVRPFLPRETQGYVPNFVAAAYLLTYHAEHNIIPAPAKMHESSLDTLCLKNGVDMNVLSQMADWDIEEIKALNPIYKTTYIPRTTPPQCINGPLEKIGLLVSNEEGLYKTQEVENDLATVDDDEDDDEDVQTIVMDAKGFFNHTVRRGENLALIANRYNVTVKDIQLWNSIRGTAIYVGQKLRIAGDKGVTIQPTKTKAAQAKYYSVRKGDTFGVIASRYGMTQTQLKRMNPGINISRLSIGQRIKVK